MIYSTHLRSDPLENILGRKLAQNDTHEQKRLSRIELILSDTHFHQKPIGQSIRNVSPFELKHVEAQEQQWQDSEIELPADSLLLGLGVREVDFASRIVRRVYETEILLI
jgi:hypothetical protein